ncbi:MAG: tetratricopeptide repeat protein [Byssovorax sp.]
MKLGMTKWPPIAALVLAACGAPKAPPPEQLTADPPLGSTSADTGAADTELERGIAYLKNDRADDARLHLEKSLQLKPSGDAHYYLGLAREKLGDKPGAIESYKAALALDGKLAEAAANLGAIYLDDPPHPDEAIAALMAGLAKSPGDARLGQNLAYAYGLKGDVQSASKQYDSVLAKGEDPMVRFAYGTMLFEHKELDKAAEQLKKALAGLKDDAPLLVTVGRMLGGSKAFGECVTAFDRAIKLKATEPEWFVRRGTCRHEIKDEAGAQDDFRAAIKVDPKFAAAHYYLGLSLLGEKKRGGAIASLEKAAALGGDIGKAAKEKIDALSKKK